MRFAFSLVLLAACYDETKPLPPYYPDYPPSPPMVKPEEAEVACSNLRNLGCPEGHGAIGGTPCSVVIQRAADLRPLPVACWTLAKSTADARACGSLRCLR
jgi:hypothetical protein